MLRDIIQDIEHTYNSSFKSVEKAMQRSMMYMLDRALPGQYLCDLFYSDGSYETEDVTLKDFIRTAAVEVSKIAC